MVRLAFVAIAAAVLPQAAARAGVQPSALVLRATDVPAHYDFDKDNSRPLPKAFMATNPVTRHLLDRTGYVNGHVVRFLNSDPPRWRYVTSQAFIFRTAAGARVFLASLGNRLGARAHRRKAVDLGDAGWSYVSASSEPGAVVAWRFGRVVGVVACQEMAGRRALSLALARKQQRRIAKAPR